MISSPKELMVEWYSRWKADLDSNLAKQAELKADEERLQEIIATFQKAFAALFPETPDEPPTTGPTGQRDNEGDGQDLAGPGETSTSPT